MVTLTIHSNGLTRKGYGTATFSLWALLGSDPEDFRLPAAKEKAWLIKIYHPISLWLCFPLGIIATKNPQFRPVSPQFLPHLELCPTRFAELLILFSYSKVLALSDGEVLCTEMGTRIAELLNLELTS